MSPIEQADRSRGEAVPDTAGFRACYLHPKRPAIKNCQYCEKPICAQCELESGDHRMCGPCKKKLVSSAAPGTRPQAEPLGLGEVTVFRDGTVAGSDLGQPDSEGDRPADGALRPVEQPGETQGPEPEAPGDTPNVSEKAPSAEMTDRVEKSEEPGGALRQIAYALPFALATTAGVAGGWLLMAVILKQWTQISVLTLGLAVPWVFYKTTTRKKRSGERVWTETPVVLVSIFSFTLVAVTAPLLEYLVYQLVFSGFMKSDVFVMEYFDTLGWTLISLGLVSSLLTPFLLKVGDRWDVPRLKLRSRRRPAGL